MVRQLLLSPRPSSSSAAAAAIDRHRTIRMSDHSLNDPVLRRPQRQVVLSGDEDRPAPPPPPPLPPLVLPLQQDNNHNNTSCSRSQENGKQSFFRSALLLTRRVKNWLFYVTSQELCLLMSLLIISSAVTDTIMYVINGRTVVWLTMLVDASVVACFIRDGRTISFRSYLLWLGLLLFLSVPILSGPILFVMAAMIVLPLQFIILRHRQDVTLELCKEPPFARVKSVDFHPTEPILVLAYYTGHVVVWDMESSSSMSSSGVAQGLLLSNERQPVRSVRFLRNHQQQHLHHHRFVAADDNGRLTLFEFGFEDSNNSYSSSTRTVKRIADVQAHSDFVRSVDVHPTQPLVITCSDDRTIKLWEVGESSNDNGNNNNDYNPLILCRVLEGHEDFVMQVRFHPVAGSSFVAASLDHTIQKWDFPNQIAARNTSTASSSDGGGCGGRSLCMAVPVATFRGHQQGVLCVDFSCRRGEETLLVSGSDDRTIKVWNYEDQTLIHSFSAVHEHNINAVLVHPEFPLLVSASEDGICKVWKLPNESSLNLEMVLNLDKGRSWTLAASSSGSMLALGFDQGCVVMNLVVNDVSRGAAVSKLGEDFVSDSTRGRCYEIEKARLLSHVDFVLSGIEMTTEDPTSSLIQNQTALPLQTQIHYSRTGSAVTYISQSFVDSTAVVPLDTEYAGDGGHLV